MKMDVDKKLSLRQIELRFGKTVSLNFLKFKV